MSEWIRVSERLPDEDSFVLVVDVNDGDDVGLGCYVDDLWWWEPDLPMSTPPTHWMPLPEPPK